MPLRIPVRHVLTGCFGLCLWLMTGLPVIAGELPGVRFQPVKPAVAGDKFAETAAFDTGLRRQINVDGAWTAGDIQSAAVSGGGYRRNLSAEGLGANLALPVMPALSEVVSLVWEREVEGGRHRVSADYLFRNSALFRTGGSLKASAAFTEKRGGAVSIRPLMDPTLLPAGSDLAVRLYHRGEPLRGTVIRALHTGSGQQASAVSDGQGIAIVRLQSGGEWQLSFDLRDARETDASVLHTAVLQFSIPEAK